MLALRLGNVARIEIAKLLRCGRRQRHDRDCKQQDALTHLHPPLRTLNQARRI
jgi:hypothetical protein